MSYKSFEKIAADGEKELDEAMDAAKARLHAAFREVVTVLDASIANVYANPIGGFTHKPAEKKATRQHGR